MQITTRNHDRPGVALFASATGAWYVLESVLGFRSFAPGFPGVAAAG